jgi:hypothetical protein
MLRPAQQCCVICKPQQGLQTGSKRIPELGFELQHADWLS